MDIVYNFSAGPACLPAEVIQKAQRELSNYEGSGMSVMEMSHRSKDYGVIIQNAEESLRALMHIPDNYKVLFLQGGASTQFAMIPLNLMKKYKRAHFINTGIWSKRAISEASRYGEANVVASSEDKVFSYIPNFDAAMFTSEADYVHITSNNTIYGTRFTTLPETNGLPLVSDMSSCILSEDINVSKYGVIYAGAQKNVGPAGVTIVIIRNDLVGDAMDITPTMLNYQTHADKASMYNTPPTFAIYMAGLVFEWIDKRGGLCSMEETNEYKAKHLYDFIDESNLFRGTAKETYRSLMNVPFVTGDAQLDAKFVSEAAKEGLVTLKGHRSVGGMRASIYNAMPIEGVEKLVRFMKAFEINNQ